MSDHERTMAPTSGSRVLEILSDSAEGRAESIELPDGSRRIRKTASAKKHPHPWGVERLRAEIHYLRSLPPGLAAHFPAVLACWGLEPGAEQTGLEMPLLEAEPNAGVRARSGGFTQAQADRFQESLADVVLKRLHEPEPPRPAFANHLEHTLREALARLERDAETGPLIRASEIELNGRKVPGPGECFQRLVARGDLHRALASGPCVRLHGELTLENAIWTEGRNSRLLLLNPVSRAGVSHGPPLFDLVRYESSATGELHALAEGLAQAEAAGHECQFRVRWEDPALRCFRIVDLHSRFRTAYRARHGEIPRDLYALLEAYFALVDAAEAEGARRWAGTLKAAQALAAAEKPGQRV